MEKMVMKTAKTETGYSCACDLLPGWVVSYGDDFEGFKKYVRESIDFYLEGRRTDGLPYPSVFGGEYEIIYDFVAMES